MASSAAFKLLRVNLGYGPGSVPPAVKDSMHNKLDAAAAELADAGIPIDETNARDLELLVCYAQWLYEGRSQQTAQPLQLRRLLRNRQAAIQTGGAT